MHILFFQKGADNLGQSTNHAKFSLGMQYPLHNLKISLYQEKQASWQVCILCILIIKISV